MYDRKVVRREFKPGEKVLILFPTMTTPLKPKYQGPFEVLQKLSDTNYLIATPERRKKTRICHINLLKKYREPVQRHEVRVIRNTRTDQRVSETLQEVRKDEVCEKEDSAYSSKPTVETRLKNSEILDDLDIVMSHLSEKEKVDVREILHKHREGLGDVPTPTSVLMHDIEVGDSAPIKQSHYRVLGERLEKMKDEVDYLLKNDIVEPSSSPWGSPCILVDKPDGSIRMCTDYRKVNQVTRGDAYPIPRMEDCLDAVGKAKYVSKIDLTKGYYSVRLTEKAKEISAFVTPFGQYQYKRMPFGLKNAPASFQRLMNKVVGQVEGCRVYLDDIVVYSQTWEEHCKQLDQVLQLLREAGLTPNLAKCEFGKTTVTYLGHEIGQGQLKPIHSKVEAIEKVPIPTGKRQLRRFLGMTGYYRKFCQNYAQLAAPLTDLLKKEKTYRWTDECQVAFEQLKKALVNAPILATPDMTKQFSLSTDASDKCIGAVLMQTDDSGEDHPIAFLSKKLNKHQLNYSVIEKETLALIIAIEHFAVYLRAALYPVMVYTDHNPLVFLGRMKNSNQRLMRWSLMLQEYPLIIQHVKGKDNVIADSLSRMD